MDLLPINQTSYHQGGCKLATIKYAGSARKPENIEIYPGQTCSEILNILGLDSNFQLSKGTPDSVFGLDEVLYPIIDDGTLLFASSRVDAGQ